MLPFNVTWKNLTIELDSSAQGLMSLSMQELARSRRAVGCSRGLLDVTQHHQSPSHHEEKPSHVIFCYQGDHGSLFWEEGWRGTDDTVTNLIHLGFHLSVPSAQKSV